MALDKLVDSTQLDSDLTSVANAIRAKSGGSGQLAFPAGFVSEIGNIPSGGGSEVPTGYTQLEYIAGDGTAYIDTGEKRQSGDVIELFGGMIRKSSSGTNAFWHPFGTPNCFMQGNNTSLPTATGTVHLNSGGNATSKTFSTYLTHWIITDTKLEQYDYLGTISRTVATISGTVSTDTKSLVLFGRRTASDGVDYKANGFGIFRFKWSRNNALIHDMVPAMRDSDSVLGLYDIVTNSFLTNGAGSGSFSGGTRE